MAPSNKEIIAKIRELESRIASDPKQANDILLVKQHLASEVTDIKLASLHALRRLFITFLDSGRLTISATQPAAATNVKSSSKKSNDKEDSLRDYKLWLQQQLQAFQQALCGFVQAGDAAAIAPALRTLLELTKREWLIQRGGSDSDTRKARFGIRAYSALVMALLNAKEIDVDVLLLLRAEVLSLTDCSYYAWVIIKRTLRDAKHDARKALASGDKRQRADSANLIQNALDLLRVLELSDEEEIEDGTSCLVDAKLTMKIQAVGADQEEDGDDDEGGGAEEEDEDEEEESSSESEIEEEEEEEEEDLRKVVGKKSKARGNVKESSAKRPRVNAGNVRVSGRAHEPKAHKKAFSEAWLALLAMPLNIAQHKLVLKHLPEHVMPQLVNPLLLADYLYRGYASGGVVAILALQSLFALIVQHNLDYPHFFESLYSLCTVEVFSAKYRARFLNLLNVALKSVNIPAYTVAAFAKRLMQLALLVPSPSANFCVMQTTWLLRTHKSAQTLLQKDATNSSKNGQIYSNVKPKELEEVGALASSLWEAKGLQQHYLHSVAAFSKSLESASSTSTANDAPYLNVSDYIDHTYETLIDVELSRAKKNCALAYAKPTQLMAEGEFLSSAFGSVA